MHYYLITGASRGLGEALARQLDRPNNFVIGLARSPSDFFQQAAAERFRYRQFDMAEPDAAHFEALLELIDPQQAESINLICNAGVIEPLSPVGQQEASQLSRHFQVNVVSHLMLADQFVRRFQPTPVTKRLVTISSGAAVRALHGWSAYCSSKAALLHYTRCLAHEQAEQPQPVKALSIAPGVVDTQMQTQLRSKTEAETAVAGRFQRMKATGELTPPDQAAREVLEIMFDPQAPAGEALDTRAYHG